MAETWLDQMMRGRAESWRRIRTLRSSPPSLVLGDEREFLYKSALEQAEQQFLAAARVPVESRAINLFYGLSQAGRAIACAYAGKDFRLSGHGLSTKIENLKAEQFPSMEVTGEVRGKRSSQTSFIRISELLDSALLKESTPIKRLWSILLEPHTRAEPLTSPAWPRPLTTGTPRESAEGWWFSTALPASLPGPSDIQCLKQEFPSLRRLSKIQKVQELSEKAADTVSVNLLLEKGTEPFLYRRAQVFLPSPVPDGVKMHPLMAWWGILHALSMLTRYGPETWCQLVDVDASKYAVPIGFALDVALDSVPDMIAEVLDAAPSH